MRIRGERNRKFGQIFSKAAAVVMAISMLWTCIPQTVSAETEPAGQEQDAVVPVLEAQTRQSQEQTFVHPGMLHTAEAFEKAKQNVTNQVQPNLDTWNVLLNDGYTKDAGWARPLQTVVRGGTGQNYAQFYIDITRAYQKALAWKVGDIGYYGDQACSILNSWSATMTGIAGNADRYLAAGIYGYELANVAEIMRDHPSFDKEAMDNLLLNVFYPMNNWFLRNHNDAHFGNYWANWDLCNIASIMAIGIFTDREDIYNQAIEYYKSGMGNGSLYNAMPFAFDNGMAQWQESCRDQGHCTFGIGLCAAICEMAWNQGDDLYRLSDNRFLKAAEYVAAYNSGVEGLPFESYIRYSGQKGNIENWGLLSGAGRGSCRPIYAMIYNHYVNRRGLEAPHLKNILFPNNGYIVEGNTRKGDELGWGTLMYANLDERIEDVPVQGFFADGIYRIRSGFTGRSLVVNEEGNLLSADTGTREDEWWKLENLGDGEYIITNMLTNKVMQINDKSYAQGAVIGTGEKTGELNQKFGFARNSNGTYRLVSSMTTYVAGIAGDTTAENAAIIQWKINGNTGQSWILERKSEVLAGFTFDDEDTGFTDGNGVAEGGHSLQEHDGGNALYLNGTSDFLKVSAENGESLLTGVKELTVSFQAKPEGGNQWLFYAAPNEEMQTGQNETYLGILQNADGTVSIKRYKNQGENPADVSAAVDVNADGWYYMTVVYTENETILYVNGEEKTRQSSEYPLADILGDNSILYIGKANCGDGEYYQGLIDNYTIYGRALTPEEIKAEASRYVEVPDILAQFTFDDKETGFTNGYGVASGGYTLKKHGKGNALYLDGIANFLEVETIYGTSLLNHVKEMSVSFQAKPEGGVNWVFYAAPDENTQAYLYEKYLGIMQSTDGTATAQRYKNQGARPADTVASAKADSSGWYDVTVVYTETDTILYVDGKEVARQSGQYALSDILGENSILYIGKANWGKEEYYKGLIDNYTIYGYALTPEAIQKSALQSKTEEIDPSESVRYTEETWLVYEKALNSAKEVLANSAATLEELSAAADALDEARAGLKRPEILADFTFDDEESGFTNGYGVASGSYSLQVHGEGNALYLDGTSNFLEVTVKDGSSLLTDAKELTVSFQAKPEKGANWLFYASPDEKKQKFANEKYLGILQNIDGTATVQRYKNQGERPADTVTAAEADDSGWYNLTVVYTEEETILYVDGKEAARQSGTYALADILGEESVLYIGKANWGNGEYYKGFIDNYKIIGRALTPEEVAEQAGMLALRTAVEGAKEEQSYYTDESWEPYKEAVTAAKAVLAKEGATPAEVDAAVQNLKEAKAALEIQCTGTYHVKNIGQAGQGLVPDGDSKSEGSNIITWPGQEREPYYWALKPVEGGYQIVNADNGLVMTYADGGIKQYQAGERDGQTWVFEAVEDAENQYRIKNVAGNTYLTLGNTLLSGYSLSAAEKNERDSTQIWTLEAADVYIVQPEVTNGTADPQVKSVAKGANCDFTVTADEGYEIDSITVNGTALDKSDYTVSEEGIVTFTLRNITENTYVVVTNVKKNATEFYAWKEHETMLPLRKLKGLCDADGGDMEALDNSDCIAAKGEGGIAFTGKVPGDIVIHYSDTDGKINAITVHVYEPENKAYVLDYGLPVDLNQEGDSCLGVMQISGTDKYTILGVKPEPGNTGVSAEFLGIRSHKEDVTTWVNEYSDDAQNSGKSTLKWNGTKVVYTPSTFMEGTDVYDYRVDVKPDLNMNLDAETSTSAEGVRMSGTITVVPAEVVYYEDDFSAITVSGTSETEGVTRERLQSNNQNEAYGYDAAYVEDDILIHYDFSKVEAQNGEIAADSVVRDMSGNGYDAVARGGSIKVSGDVLTLPGENADTAPYLELPGGFVSGKEALTVSMWLRSDRVDWFNSAFYLGQADGNKSQNWQLNPRTDMNVLRPFVYIGTDPGLQFPLESRDCKAMGVWALYTMTLEPGKWTLYYDGRKVGERVDPSISLAGLGEDPVAYIANSGYAADFYQGDIRDVRIYDGALSEQRVVELYNETKLDGNLLLHYDFSTVEKETDGTVNSDAVVADLSGNNKTGYIRQTGAMVNGDTLTLPGGASDSEAAYVELPGGLTNGKTAMTVSVWMRDKTTTERSFYAMYIGSNNAPFPTRYWALEPKKSDGNMESVVTLGSFGNARSTAAPSVSDEMSQYTVVLENNKMTLYSNGVKVDENLNTGINVQDLQAEIGYIGTTPYRANGDDYFAGDVRDVRIYDRALTEEEIKGLYSDNGAGRKEYTPDSAGSSTRLVADSGDARGIMTFTFKGTGLDVVGRTTTDTAGVMVIVRESDETGKVVKSKIVDTYYANGKLYQLPIISMKNLSYGTYHVTIKALKTKSGADQTNTNDSVYIDGIRIYNPAGSGKADENKAVTDLYKKSEYRADVVELRGLLLGSVTFNNLQEILDKYGTQTGESTDGTEEKTVITTAESKITLVGFDETLGTLIYGQGKTQVENLTGAVMDSVPVLEDVLKCGPNNEVYLAKGSAVAFRAIPVSEVPEKERTLQIEAKKVADDKKDSAEVTIPYQTDDGAYSPKTNKIKTYTPMYYEVNMEKCKRYPDGSYLVILASTGESMVSFTNIKVKGYVLEQIEDEASASSGKIVEDTYNLMRLMYMGEPEEPQEHPDDSNTENQKPDIQEPDIQEPDIQEKPEEQLPFVDVSAESWYEPYVRYVYGKKIMTGLDKSHFGPDQSICRAQFAVILHRIAGSPGAKYQAVFKDVTDNQFYTDAVMWAAGKNQKIITGYTDASRKGYFGSADNITREQIATMLYRYAKSYKGYDVTEDGDYSQFPDAGNVQDFAGKAMRWAVENEMIKGKTVNGQLVLDPQGSANRAECAAVIQRFLEKYE